MLTILLLEAGSTDALASNHSGDYQMGTYVSVALAGDGTITSTLHGDGTTTAGSVYENQLEVYRISVADGMWVLNTYTQAKDSMIRGMGMTPIHFKSEKNNPLDVLRDGDKVLFRVEKHRKLNGVETSIFIPYADNPDKEFRFIATFYPSAPPTSQPEKPTDNVTAMCQAHKLSPELEKQYCGSSTAPALSPVSASPNPSSNATSQFAQLDKNMVASVNLLTCDQIQGSLLSNPLVVKNIVNYLPLTLQSIQLRCPAEAKELH